MVVRAFENAGALLQKDANLLGFARASGKNPTQFLTQLRSDRRLAAISDQSDAHIGLHLTMALLFFASHELGHLIDKRDFQSFVDAGKNERQDPQIRSAIVKTCRHAEQFYNMGFGLAGLDLFVKEGSESRQVEQEYRKEVADQYEDSKERFEAEDRADNVAAKLMVNYISQLRETNRQAAIERQHLMVETLFILEQNASGVEYHRRRRYDARGFFYIGGP